MALKAHKIALRATEKHRSWFAQQCGYGRVAFNYGLSDFKDGLSKGELRSGRDYANGSMPKNVRSLTGAAHVTSVLRRMRLIILVTLSNAGSQDKTDFRNIRSVLTVSPIRLKVRR